VKKEILKGNYMEIVEIGTLPPIGVVPEFMYAQVIRQSRYGMPEDAYKIEKIKIPKIKDNEVLVAVMAAGLNFNSIWAARGYPIDMIQLIQLRKDSTDDFQIAGSDCSGIVYKIGSKVKNVKVGDEVVLQAGWYDEEDPWIKNGGDIELAPSVRAWGYETSWGTFAQFCIAKHFQCLPKPKHLSWEKAAVYMLSGATAYRMLYKYEPHVVKKGDVVLIWGGAGGLGTMAIQLVLLAGGIPIAVVNTEEKRKYCENMGALVIDRTEFDCWGALTSEMLKPDRQKEWQGKAKVFLKKILELTGGKLPRIVFEHSGEATMAISLFVCDKDGMVITCAGTTGYLGTFDIRYLWLQRKRIQGSHFADVEECIEFNNLIAEGKVEPVLASTVVFEDLPKALQIMYENKHKGNTAIKIGYR
jgi:crotonyl-CoA carboxylase/reductase